MQPVCRPDDATYATADGAPDDTTFAATDAAADGAPNASANGAPDFAANHIFAESNTNSHTTSLSTSVGRPDGAAYQPPNSRAVGLLR